MMIDHVHLLLEIPPKYSVSQVMGYVKGKTELEIFDKHANLKYKYGNRHFEAEGYYVSTVGINEATDKLSVREYEDPFGEDKEIRINKPLKWRHRI